MFDLSQTIEGLVRFLILMLPVLGVLLLFVAAHIIGGAMSSRGHQATRGAAAKPERTRRIHTDTAVPRSPKSGAA